MAHQRDTDHPDQLDLVSETALAAQTGISRSTLGYLRRTQGLPHVRVSARVIRYRASEVCAWLAARHHGAVPGDAPTEDAS